MNKSSNSPTKSSPSNSKSKKSAKEREKRRNQNTAGKQTSENSLTKAATVSGGKQYAGLNPKSVQTYAQQNSVEHNLVYFEDICKHLAEDVNYRLRYIIYSAAVKARCVNRNHITSKDIDETFKRLNIERTYGAPDNPEWLQLPDEELYFLNDERIDLHETSRAQYDYLQPADVVVEKSWCPDDANPALQKYFTAMCNMITSEDERDRIFALSDLRSNECIGPAIEWFYNFAYHLVSNFLYCEFLTMCAVDIVIALDENLWTYQSVSEKQLNVLTRIILTRILSYSCSSELLNGLCYVLKVLGKCVDIKNVVVTTLAENFGNFKEEYGLEILKITAAMEFQGVENLFLPNLDFFLSKIEEKKETSWIYAVMEIFKIINLEGEMNNYLYEVFHKIFKDDIVMFSNHFCYEHKVSEKEELNYFAVKTKLMKTRRKIAAKNNPKLAEDISKYFEIHKDLSRKRNIRIIYNNKKQEEEDNNKITIRTNKKEDCLIIGKISLLMSEFSNAKSGLRYNKCYSHTLCNYCL